MTSSMLVPIPISVGTWTMNPLLTRRVYTDPFLKLLLFVIVFFINWVWIIIPKSCDSADTMLASMGLSWTSSTKSIVEISSGLYLLLKRSQLASWFYLQCVLRKKSTVRQSWCDNGEKTTVSLADAQF